MKFVLAATALVAAVSANMNDMLPFLMMDSMGNQYYQDSNGNLIPLMMAMGGNKMFKGNNAMLPLMMSGNSNIDPTTMMMMSGGNKMFKGNNAMLPLMMSGNSNISPTTMMMMGGNKMFKGNNAMLPFLMSDAFGNTYYSSAPSGGVLGGNPLVTAQLMGDKVKAGRALSNEQILLLGGGLQNGLSDPTSLMTLASNKRYDFGTAVALGADIPTMAAAGNLKGLNYGAKSMALPFVVDSLADGRQASLRGDVIPAMAMMGEKINMETILPWMMTDGQRYLGGDFGRMLPFMGGNTFKKAFKADNLMPWLIQGFGQGSYYYAPPAAPVAPIRRPSYIPYAPIGAPVAYTP